MAVQEAPPIEDVKEEEQLPNPRPTLFEGYRVDEHRLNFVGNVPLVDAEIVKQIKLGGDFELVIRGRVTNRGHKAKTDKEGNKLGAVSSSTLYIESVSEYDPD